MRTFDYEALPKRLFSGKAAEANAQLFEDKGKLQLLEKMHPELLADLKRDAHIDNVNASTRIEGLYVDPARVRELVEGALADGTESAASPADETEAQIVGYSRALSIVEGNHTSLDLSTGTVVALYEALYSHRDLGRKSRYRKKDYIYVQVDGHMQALPVSPITAFETPLVLGGACDGLAEAFASGSCSPLVLAAVFTVDFLCIRPFDEGNGRISRLFADLLLMKSGFDIARYASVDSIIERAAMDYYDALNACVDGWDRSANDYEPYVVYWLGILHQAYDELFDAIDARVESAGAGKSERVRLFVRRAGKPVAKRELREAFPDISEATIENALGAMVKAGEVEKLGAGRSTTYRWKA